MSLAAASDPLKDGLGDDVELLIHLDFSTNSYGRVDSQKNSNKAKLRSGSWQGLRAAYSAWSNTQMSPWVYTSRVGCFSAASMGSFNIMEYVPATTEADDMKKIDISSGHNRYIFAVGKPYTYPNPGYPWEVISMGELYTAPVHPSLSS